MKRQVRWALQERDHLLSLCRAAYPSEPYLPLVTRLLPGVAVGADPLDLPPSLREELGVKLMRRIQELECQRHLQQSRAIDELNEAQKQQVCQDWLR